MAPHMISKALRSRRSKNKDVDSIIRKHLYKEIVHKLKLGYDQSYLVSTRKRQRPHSPSQSGRWDGDQASDSTKMAKRPASVELEQTIPSRYKKRRMPEPQAPSDLSGLILRESGNLCNNEQKGLASGCTNSYVLTLLSNNILPFSVRWYVFEVEILYPYFNPDT